MWLCTHYNVFPEKRIQQLHFHTSSGLSLVLGSRSNTCWYGVHSRPTNPLHVWLQCCFVWGASQLERSTCKLFCAPPLMLLIVLCNFVYYNSQLHSYYAMVGLGIKAKRGLHWQKWAHWHSGCQYVLPAKDCNMLVYSLVCLCWNLFALLTCDNLPQASSIYSVCFQST